MKVAFPHQPPDIGCRETRELVKRIEGLLERFSYKPNWVFGVEAIGYRRAQIKIVQHTTDVVTSRLGPLIFIWVLDYYLFEQDDAEKHFWYLLREKVHEFEIHEADEWITIDGKRVFDPHKKERGFLDAEAASDQQSDAGLRTLRTRDVL